MKEELEINQSQIVQWMKCPERWRRIWVEHDHFPWSRPLHRGSAVHKGAQFNFAQKVKSHRDLKAKEVIDMAVTSAQESVKADGLALSRGETSQALAVNSLEKSVATLTGLFMLEVAPKYQPLLVEHKQVYALPERVADFKIKIHGTVDVIDQADVIPDLKTVTNDRGAKDYENHPQPTMYSLLFNLLNKRPPVAVVIEQLVDRVRPIHNTYVLKKTKDDWAALLSQVVAMAKSIRAGAFMGAYGQPGAWWCSKDRCEFWHTCPMVPKHKR